MLNFEADLRSIILSCLQVPDARGQAALARATTDVLLIKFLNWLNRLIHPHPRRVFKSRELMASHTYSVNGADIGRLLGKMAVGLDVEPHLSERTLVGYQEATPGRITGRKDLDLLLNDWGIHHLHLSHAPWRNGFNIRTRELLFVMVRPGEVFALDVLDHCAWAEEALVRIAVRNWPDASLFLEARGIGTSGPDGTPDRATLRSKGINAFVEFDGRSWMPATGGIVSAHTSLQATRLADWLLDRVRAYSRDRAALLRDMQAAPDNAGLHLPRKPAFRLVMASSQHSYGLAIQEEATNATLWVGG